MKAEEIDALERKLRDATEPPWAYELVGDKSGDWCIGVLLDENDQPISGEVVEPYDEETGEFGEKPVVVEAICEASDNIPNAILITSAVNALSSLLADARLAAQLRKFVEEHGEALRAATCTDDSCLNDRCVALRELLAAARGEKAT